VKIRTQLVIASFLLSIVPLTAIVGYSYVTSRDAVESAYRREAAVLTRQMDNRLAAIRTDLEQRLAEVSALPLRDLGEQSRSALVGNVLMSMGDAASLVDSIEVQPFRDPVRVAVKSVAAAKPKPAPSAPAAPLPPAVAAANHDPDPDPDPDHDPDHDPEDHPHVPEAFVIDVPPVPFAPRFQWTEEQKAQLKEITTLSVQLGQDWKTIPPEQREQIQARLKKVQQAFDASMKETLQAAHAARDRARELRAQQRAAQQAQRDRERAASGKTPEPSLFKQPRLLPEAKTPAVANVAAVAPAQKTTVKKMTPEEKERIKQRQKQATLLFGTHLNVPLRKEGEVVGQVSAQVSIEEVIKRVLGASADRDEVAFAVDRDGNVYTRSNEDRKKLEEIGLLRRLREKQRVDDIPNWVTAFTYDPQSGMRIAVARPIGDTFDELRRTAAKNFGYGMALVFIALIGIVPIANHITRDVNLVARGAERIAQGDLTTRLPVTSKNEFGQLASSFNRMAQDLSVQQQTIVEQERERKDFERKSIEMEEARRFQLSMLPKSVPSNERYEVAVYTQTATEVGGDYYDFNVDDRGALSVTVGDATGHGAKAGTMVTVIKTLFAGYTGWKNPSDFLHDAADTIKRMDLGRMAMALVLARVEGARMTIASAGMPPAYVYRRASGEVEEISVGATPLGTLGGDYADTAVDLSGGDTVLFMTDGFPELLNLSGQQLGYVAAQQEFATAAAGAGDANEVIARLAEAAKRWHGDQPPNDDVTFVVVRARTG
jgi:serine phosphatase RsbU (regulator of sigma subunit)